MGRVFLVTDYKKLSLSLFNDITVAIDILKQAQQKTEGLYMGGENGRVVELLTKPESASATSKSRMCTVELPHPGDSCFDCWLRVGVTNNGKSKWLCAGVKNQPYLPDDFNLRPRPDFCPLIVEAQP